MRGQIKHYLISGRVQGVGFRAYTHRVASRLALRGWVRNLIDGRVEVLASGEENLLTEFESLLRQGPPAGQVDQMDVVNVEVDLQLTGFSVQTDGKAAWQNG